MRRRRTPATPPRPDLAGRPDVPKVPAALPARRRGRRAVAAVLALALVAGASAASLVQVLGVSTGEYSFLAEGAGRPFRWNPCAPIHYQVNPEHAPPSATEDLTEALARVTSATGISFVYDGVTDRTHEDQLSTDFRDPRTGDYQPVLIVWLPPGVFDDYADAEMYGGFAIPRTQVGLEAPSVFRSGVIVVNAATNARPGFQGRFSLGPLLMHEWGHILGLGHVGSGEELMWSDEVPGADEVPVLTQEDWGSGDLEGLARLGRDAGCLPGPD